MKFEGFKHELTENVSIVLSVYDSGIQTTWNFQKSPYTYQGKVKNHQIVMRANSAPTELYL